MLWNDNLRDPTALRKRLISNHRHIVWNDHFFISSDIFYQNFITNDKIPHGSSLLRKKYHIETRAGCACAGPYGHDLLGLKDNQKLKTKPGWLRISLHYTHEKEDIDYFFNALNKTIIKLSH